MTEPEKPLHVRVAEALGWTEIIEAPISPLGWGWTGQPPPDAQHGPWITAFDLGKRTVTLSAARGSVDRFDLDWACGGPLIEQYGILLIVVREPGYLKWTAYPFEGGSMDIEAQAPRPLEAVCHLILALAAAGKLEKVKP